MAITSIIGILLMIIGSFIQGKGLSITVSSPARARSQIIGGLVNALGIFVIFFGSPAQSKLLSFENPLVIGFILSFIATFVGLFLGRRGIF